MIEKLTDALIAEGFSVSDYGFDLYEQDSWFSKHVDIVKSPIENSFLVELKIAWGNTYAENGIPPRAWELGNCYLSTLGVTWLHPNYPDEGKEFIFNENDLEFLSTQGIHFIKKWFSLHTNLDFLIGLCEYQGKFKSALPSEIYDFLGYASNKHTKRYDSLAFLYAMKGDFKKSMSYLKRYGISDMQSYSWTQKFAKDLEMEKCYFIKPYDFKSKYTRGGGIFLEENPEPYRAKLLDNAHLLYISPGKAS